MGEMIERGLVGVLSVVLIGLVGYVIVTKLSAPDDMALFGQGIFDLCSQPGNKVEGALEADARIFPIDDVTHTRYVELVPYIPENRRAVSKSDLDAVICVKDRMQNVENETYYQVKSGKPVAGCVREQHITDVYLIDVKTAKTIAHQQLLGTMPGVCPERIKDTMYKRGDPVSVDKLAEWLNIQLN